MRNHRPSLNWQLRLIMLVSSVAGILIWLAIIAALVSFTNRVNSDTSQPIVGAPYDWYEQDQTSWVPRRDPYPPRSFDPRTIQPRRTHPPRDIPDLRDFCKFRRCNA